MASENVANFWNGTKQQLAQFEVSFTLQDVPELALNSFNGIQMRGWYTVPTDLPPSGRLPAVLAVPGYGGMKDIPTHLAISGFGGPYTISPGSG